MKHSFGKSLAVLLTSLVGLHFITSVCHAVPWKLNYKDGEQIPLRQVTFKSNAGRPVLGTFWSMQRTHFPPLPCLSPLLFEAGVEIPVYALDAERGVYLLDDRAVDYDALYKARVKKKQEETLLRSLELNMGLISMEEFSLLEGEGGGGMEMMLLYSSTDLWIEILAMTNNTAYLRLHGTEEFKKYQLLSKTNLAQVVDWTPREYLYGAAGTNETDFSPLDVAGVTNMFFKAHKSENVVFLSPSSSAFEPSAVLTNGWASPFILQCYTAENVTIYYRIRGTASNGVDYTNLVGHVTIPANVGVTNIYVKPLQDGLNEGAETVILTLVETNGYLIEPTQLSATMLINDSPTTVSVNQYNNLAVETNGPPGTPGQVGSILFNRSDDTGINPAMGIKYAVSGTASNGVDYTFLNGTLNFAEGETFKFLDVVPLHDTLFEGIETVIVTLQPSNTYVIDTNNSTQTVTLADSSTTVAFGYSADVAIEANGPTGIPAKVVPFYIYRTDWLGQFPALTVLLASSGTASNGVDYTNITQVTIPAGTNAVYGFIHPISDNIVEGVEMVTLTIIPNGDNYLIDTNDVSQFNQSFTIIDTTTTVFFQTFGSDFAIEPDGPPGAPAKLAQFTLQRSDTRLEFPTLTVLLTMSGTASNGVDYTNMTQVIFPTNVTSVPVYIHPLGDNLVEGTETVVLTIRTNNDTYLINTNAASRSTTISDTSMTMQVFRFSNAVEPNPALVPKQTGRFDVNRDDTRSPAIYPSMTVNYQISGTASNGVDYTNLTGTVTFQTNENIKSIFIEPLYDDTTEGNETVIITLIPSGDDFMINPARTSATNLIVDNVVTNIFRPVAKIHKPVGIDYHVSTESLIVSTNTPAGTPLNFARIFTNTSGATVITNWSGIGGVPDEVKLVTIKTNGSGFTNGDMYFGNGTKIGWLSANGSVSNMNWCTLTNAAQTNALFIRGSLCQDQTGIFSNKLVAVTSGEFYTESPKGVWLVDAGGTPSLLATINTYHLEGVIVLPNDTNQFGPWAGKIVTADEYTETIYSISTSGVVTPYDTSAIVAAGIRGEDFEIIPPNQDFYACDSSYNYLTMVSQKHLTNHVGSLMITDAGEYEPPGKVFILKWNPAITNFDAVRWNYTLLSGGGSQFEHATFAPIKLPFITP